MSVDTKAKRMTMLAFASPLAWQAQFVADGSVDADDRAHLLHLYGGNALNGVVTYSSVVPVYLKNRRIVRRVF